MVYVLIIGYTLVVIHTRNENDTGIGDIKKNGCQDLLSVNTSQRIGPLSVHTTFETKSTFDFNQASCVT